jgi:hypothetical protein
MLVRRAALVLGVLLVGLVACIATAVTGAFSTDGPQLAGTMASHVGMLLILWGVAPALRRALVRVDEVPDGTLHAWLGVAVVVPFVVVVTLLVVTPQALHQVLTREWGIVEPLQVALYVCGIWLCRIIIGRLPAGDAARALYKVGALGILVLILEEVDYLGLLALAFQLAGARGGRLGRKHIGGFHDVVDAGTQFFGLVAIAAAGLVVLIVLWILLGRYRAALLREATRVSAVPLALFVVAMLGAQLTDIDDLMLPTFLAIRGVEEALELLAALALDAGLILRLRATYEESVAQ